MAQGLLTDKNVKKVRKICDELIKYPGLIDNSVSTFEEAINNANVSEWVSDTQTGQETKAKVVNNNNAFHQLAEDIRGIYQTAMQLADASERSNNS